MLGEPGPVKVPVPGGRIVPLAAALIFLLLTPACGDGGGPRREVVDGIEQVQNRVRPADGITLPAPEPAAGLLLLAAGEGDHPRWTAIRDVRLLPGGGLAVLDLHRTDVTWFDRAGGLVATMDLSGPGLDLTSPTGIAFDSEGGVSIDMALRRVLSFTTGGELRGTFRITTGLPLDLDLGRRGDIYVLTSSHPDGGRTHLLQVRRYGAGGAPLLIAGHDSLLVEESDTSGAGDTAPLSISVNERNTLYAAGHDYTIYQVTADGRRRVITRPTIESRVPDRVLERRRARMSRRISSQQQEVAVTETVAIVQVVALDRGGVLVQTNEWHPDLLDDTVAAESTILLLDTFSDDGTYERRHAVILPWSDLDVTLTDEAENNLCGFAVPTSGESSLLVFRFRLPDVP